MTREEAIERIERVIENKTYHLDNVLDSLIQDIAEEVMNTIEKEIKMIPPSRYLEIFKVHDNGWD